MTGVLSTPYGLRSAIEGTDPANLKAHYAEDVVVTIIDSTNSPSRPKTLTGISEIGTFLDDVCSRNMTHLVGSVVMDGNRLGYLESCRYGDGTRVKASNMADCWPGGIVRQTVVQARDSCRTERLRPSSLVSGK